MKTIRLNNKQRRWVLGYLHTSKDYDPTDPFVILLRALLERPEVTDIHVREDQPIMQVMIKGMAYEDSIKQWDDVLPNGKG